MDEDIIANNDTAVRGKYLGAMQIVIVCGTLSFGRKNDCVQHHFGLIVEAFEWQKDSVSSIHLF